MPETNPLNYVGSDARRALEDFSDAFRSAYELADVEPWATSLGYPVTSGALKTTFPLPIHAAGYLEFKGDMRYRSLLSRSMTMLQRIWQDGVKELADKVERDMFIGWVDQPRVMALEAKRAPNDWLAARLAENPKSDLYADPDLKVASTVDFFSASHLNNVLDANFGTYDNTATGDTDDPFNATSERASRNHFNGLLGPNGKPLGLSKTHVIVPTTREEQAREFYEQDLLIQAVQNAAGTENVAAVTQKNRYKGTVQIVVARELADQNAYYELALNKPGMHPWVVLTDGPPEEILQDKSSGLYAEHLQIALSYILRGNVELAMPNCVRRVTLS